jgi:hypothetical protein
MLCLFLPLVCDVLNTFKAVPLDIKHKLLYIIVPTLVMSHNVYEKNMYVSCLIALGESEG